MNNAENHAQVELRRKSALEDQTYELLERGEAGSSRPRVSSRLSPRLSNDYEFKSAPSRRSTPSPPSSVRAHGTAASITQLQPEDMRNFALLVVLYMLQGVPVGLAFGSIPFLLKSKLSYGQVGIVTLASYPYSLKLLWSPIVDGIYSRSLGRRKSWIVPMQLVCGILLIWLGHNIDSLLESAQSNLYLITGVFFVLIFLSATQDIAVDGWALTLLSTDNLSYASTAQTVGMNTGYFMSFTVFLALNSPEFANKYFRAVPLDRGLLTLGEYLYVCGWLFVLVTLWLAVFKRETDRSTSEGGVKAIYHSMLAVLRLRQVQTFLLVHLVSKVGFQANEAVTNS